MIRAVVIDDEEDARVTLQNMLSAVAPDVEIFDIATGVVDGVKLIQRANPDLVFLDIQMQDGTGFDLLEMIPNPKFSVIFVTSYDNYAIRAFRFAAMDYLLKPVGPEVLADAINKFKQHKFPQQQSLGILVDNYRLGLKRMAIPTQEGVILFDVDTITHLEGDGGYTNIFSKTGERKIVSRSLKEFESLLDTAVFFRSHKSHIVNLNHVSRYVQSDGGYLVLNNGISVPVARRKKDELEQMLGI